MKDTKVLLILTISLVCFFQTFAQTEGESIHFDLLRASDKKEILVGFKIYPGFSDTWRSDYVMGWTEYSFSPKTSLNGGLSILMALKENSFYLEAELSYLNRGYKATLREVQNELEQNEILINDYYLTIPLSVLFNKKWFYIGGGVNMGYLIKKKQIINGEYIPSNDLSPSGWGVINSSNSRFLYGIQLKTGANIEVSENLSLRCELFISPTSVWVAYLNHGIGLGLIYKIK
jgi:hypothetical protein